LTEEKAPKMKGEIWRWDSNSIVRQCLWLFAL